MKPICLAVVACLSLVVASCGEQRERLLAPRPSLSETSAPVAACTKADDAEIHSLIDQLFSAGNEGRAANARFDNIVTLLARATAADDQTAQAHTLDLVDFTVRKYQQGTLLDPPGDLTTEQAVEKLVNELLCFAGLATLPEDFLDPNSAFALITPTSDTTVRTGDGYAGADFNVGDVSQPILVTITPITSSEYALYGGSLGAPLNTRLDQYPLFFKFSMSPVLPGGFLQPVEVAVCLSDPAALAIIGRLRLAHNAPDNQLEILEPLAPDSVDLIVNCAGATEIAQRDGVFRLFDLASAVMRPVVRTLLPQELMASSMFATGGVGGTTKTFSPFGAVDPMIYVTPTTTPPVDFPIGGTVPAANTPAVVVETRNHTRFPGVDVTFTAVNGSVDSAVLVTHQTNDTGAAAVTNWTLGLTAGPSTVTVTGAPPHVGSYIEPATLTFTTQAVSATQLGFHVEPSDTRAGDTLAPPVQVEGRDHLGRWVPGFRGSVTVELLPGVTLYGTTTVAATADSGRATFGGLSIRRTGTYTLRATSGEAPTVLTGTSGNFIISADTPVAISKAGGDNQSVLVTGAYATVPTAPMVLVVDQYENPVPNASVTFTVVNGGYVGGPNTTQYTTRTGSDGKASASGWMITVGTNQLDAQITGNATAWVRFTATGTTTLTNLTSQCTPSQGTGDDLSRGFYFPNSGQNRISRLGDVTLYMSSNDPASTVTGTQYTVVLTARSGSFAGTVIGTASATPFFRGTSSQNTPVNFAFSASAPAIANGVPVFFSLTATPLAGGRGGVTFNTGPCGLGDARCKTECPVVETVNTTWTGGTSLTSIFRRKGCGINIIGGR